MNVGCLGRAFNFKLGCFVVVLEQLVGLHILAPASRVENSVRGLIHFYIEIADTFLQTPSTLKMNIGNSSKMG